MRVERLVPTVPEALVLECLFFFREGASEALREAAQRNLRAGVYEAGRLSPRHENAVFAFQARIRAALGGGGS